LFAPASCLERTRTPSVPTTRADAAGCAPATASEHLRKAEVALVRTAFESAGRESSGADRDAP